MKKLITSYIFDASEKAILFREYEYSNIELANILLVTNVTDGIIIYNFADPALGGTVAGNILTLGYDTSSMDDCDKLQIFYEDGLYLIANINQEGITNGLKDMLVELKVATYLLKVGLTGTLRELRIDLDSLRNDLGGKL